MNVITYVLVLAGVGLPASVAVAFLGRFRPGDAA